QRASSSFTHTQTLYAHSRCLLPCCHCVNVLVGRVSQVASPAATPAAATAEAMATTTQGRTPWRLPSCGGRVIAASGATAMGGPQVEASQLRTIKAPRASPARADTHDGHRIPAERDKSLREHAAGVGRAACTAIAEATATHCAKTTPASCVAMSW